MIDTGLPSRRPRWDKDWYQNGIAPDLATDTARIALSLPNDYIII